MQGIEVIGFLLKHLQINTRGLVEAAGSVQFERLLDELVIAGNGHATALRDVVIGLSSQIYQQQGDSCQSRCTGFNTARQGSTHPHSEHLYRHFQNSLHGRHT
jgi:hypothetical protein